MKTVGLTQEESECRKARIIQYYLKTPNATLNEIAIIFKVSGSLVSKYTTNYFSLSISDKTILLSKATTNDN